MAAFRTLMSRIRRPAAMPDLCHDAGASVSARPLRAVLYGALILIAVSVVTAVPCMRGYRAPAILFCAAEGAVLLGAIGLLHRGLIRSASWAFLGGTWSVVTVLAVLTGGVESAACANYVAITVAAGWLLGNRGALLAAGSSLFATLAMALAEAYGLGSPHILPVPALNAWMFLGLAVALAALPLSLVLRALGDTVALTRRQVEDLRRTQEALREGEEKYRQLFELASDAVVLVDNETGRILEANNAAVALYGFERQELLARKNTDLSAEPDDTRRVTITGGTYVPVRWHRRKDGTTFPVEITGRHFTFRGRSVHVAAIRDISRRLREEEHRAGLEEQLRQSQKLESIGRLAGGVAHDFNNLLTIINGYSDLVVSELPPGDWVRMHVEQVRRAGERAASLTRQLLAFSRKQPVAPRPLCLNDVITEAGKMLRYILGDTVEFVTRLDPSLGPVMADSGQMHQVLMNLAVNARDAMPKGGTLCIETQNVPAGVTCEGEGPEEARSSVMLSVSDTGVGMDRETRQRIFEPFFTTKGNGAGTGLGLSVVYGIVRQCGGRISVASEPGKGTTFTICLPRHNGQSAAEAAGCEAGQERGTGTVLVVEDEEDVRRLAVDILKRQGYSVLEAAGGREALEMAERHPDPIDLILTDVVMPGMTGPELADRLRPLRPGAKLLYTSAHGEDVIERHRMDGPGTAFIPKPFSPQALSTKVRDLLAAGAR